MTDIAGRAQIVEDSADYSRHVADFIAACMRGCEAPFRLVLSGGSTPREPYRLLGQRTDINWSCAEIFLGDERFVPPDHPDSNYRMVHDSLLAGGKVRPMKMFQIPTDGTPEQAADAYEDVLRQQYGASVIDPAVPLFDLQILGIGADGHIASLLPGQPVLAERSRWVAAVPKGRDEVRVTLTYPAIESSRMIVFVASGAAKADIVARVRGGDTSVPAGALKPQHEVVWLLDRAAAGGA